MHKYMSKGTDTNFFNPANLFIISIDKVIIDLKC